MRYGLSAVLVGVVVFYVNAKTPAQLKQELESMRPTPTTIIKVAYAKGGNMSVFPHEMRGTSNVYCVSSEDGIIRKVNTASGSFSMVNITADGKRVIYYDWSRSTCYVSNFGGGNERKINLGGRYLVEYWRNPKDGSDWAICSDPLTSINIDDPSKNVQLSSMGNGDGGGFTDDGTMVLACCGFGMWVVPNGPFIPGKVVGGCMGSVRAGPLNHSIRQIYRGMLHLR